jgi:putative zinc finger/helix-turn-helix YgiT family protein
VETVHCYLCDVPASLVEESRTSKWGDRPVTYVDRFYRCDRCGETFYIGGMMNDSLRRMAAVIRAEDGLLAPDEIVELRRKYGLTQAQLERLIGAGAKTVVRWEKGTVAQNKTADTLLRVLRDHPAVVKQLSKQNGLTAKAPRPRSARARKKTAPAADPAVASD